MASFHNTNYYDDFIPSQNLQWMWKNNNTTGTDDYNTKIYNKINQSKIDQNILINNNLEQNKNNSLKLCKLHANKLKNNKKILTNQSIYGTQEWVNSRLPFKDKLPLLPFPELKQQNGQIIWDDQCLSYAILINQYTARTKNGKIINIKPRTSMSKNKCYATTCTHQSIKHIFNKHIKCLLNRDDSDNKNIDIPPHGKVTITDIIDNKVLICALMNKSQILSDNTNKNEYILYWIAHPENALLLALTGVLSGLVITDLNDKNYIDDEFIGFTFEHELNEEITTSTQYNSPLDKLYYLLSDPTILRAEFNKIVGFNNIESEIKPKKKKNNNNIININIINSDSDLSDIDLDKI